MFSFINNAEKTHAKSSNAKNSVEATKQRSEQGLRIRMASLVHDEAGMSTVEYALGTIAAAAFGALLYTVVTGGDITAALTSIIERALNTDV